MKKTLRELREDRCLKVKEVANAIGAFKPYTLSGYETGKSKVPDVNRRRLARFYNLPIDQIEWDVKYTPKCKRKKQTTSESTKVLAETKNELEKNSRESMEDVKAKETVKEAPQKCDLDFMNDTIYMSLLDSIEIVAPEIKKLEFSHRAVYTKLADFRNMCDQFVLDVRNMRERLNGEKEKRPYGRN